MGLTVSEVISLLLVAGTILGWFVRLERVLNQKVDRADLERSQLKAEIATQKRLEKQDLVLERICEKMDEKEEKESNFRHDSRDKLAELNLKVAVTIKQLDDLLQHQQNKRHER